MRIYNPLSKQTEDFSPAGSEATIYVCGITPYAATHLGHAFTYVANDLLIRYLEFQGYRVRYVQNLTDIDDAILREAHKEHEDWKQLGDRWARYFIEDMQTLNVLPPERYPRASETVPQIIEVVGRLLSAGVAYEAGGSVYFRVDTWHNFGKLSGIPPEEMLPIANERGNHPDDPNKVNPLDFPLWQAKAPNEPAWESPWGPGRPGWHIECSTMAAAYLGETIDLHGGGRDLAFPHHESEIAQSECAHGRQFVRFWFHTGMLHHQGRKMSKSIGNLVMMRDLLRESSPDGIRLYLSRHHYREAWEHNRSEVEEAERLAGEMREAVLVPCLQRAAYRPVLELEQVEKSFIDAMNDDLDTPRAIQVLGMMAAEIRRSASDTNVKPAQARLRHLAGVLGLRLDMGPEERVLSGWQRLARVTLPEDRPSQ